MKFWVGRHEGETINQRGDTTQGHLQYLLRTTWFHYLLYLNHSITCSTQLEFNFPTSQIHPKQLYTIFSSLLPCKQRTNLISNLQVIKSSSSYPTIFNENNMKLLLLCSLVLTLSIHHSSHSTVTYGSNAHGD